ARHCRRTPRPRQCFAQTGSDRGGFQALSALSGADPRERSGAGRISKGRRRDRASASAGPAAAGVSRRQGEARQRRGGPRPGSARFYAEAFAAQPALADDLKVGHRYNAACYAALAAAGMGEDTARLDDKEKSRLRKQALDWLRADLTLWSKQLASDKPRVAAR